MKIFRDMIVCGLLFFCIGEYALAEKTVFTVEKKKLEDKLYFSGKLKPLSTFNITSPVEGAVVKKYFHYGESLKKGQLLVELTSLQLAKDFNQSLTSYLTAKDRYQKSKNKIMGSKQLLDLGIISKNEYQTDESEHNQNHIEYLKTKYALEEFLQYDDTLSESLIEKMSIKDFKHIDQAFSEKQRTLKIYSSTEGIALMPETSEGNKKTDVGSQLKLGDVILSIGNLSGFSIQIEVSELDVTKIKKGQAVTVAGPSFPGEKLSGIVASVDGQALPAQGSNVPVFMVTVEIPHVEKQQQKYIKVGMSAEITLNVSRAQVLLVPIRAVFQKNMKHYVCLLGNKQKIQQQVETGQTLQSEVEVLSGLSSGDQVAITSTQCHDTA